MKKNKTIANKRITKILTGQKIRAVDVDNRTADFIISTDEVDRFGEVVDQNSWQLENFKKNPIVLFGHSDQKNDIMGTAPELTTEKDGEISRTIAKVKFADEGTSEGVDTVWKLVKQGILRACSIGFIPHKVHYGDEDEEPVTLSENELLEFSIVPIPANAGAVALSLKEGTLSTKDAKWLSKKYLEENALLEKQMCDSMKSTTKPTGGKGTMNAEEVKAIAEQAAKLAAKLAAKEVTDKITEELKKLKAADTDEETDKEGEKEGTDEDNADTDANSKHNDEEGAFEEDEELDEKGEEEFLEQLEETYNEEIEEGKENSDEKE